MDQEAVMARPLEVGIVVADLDGLVRFYTEALGCREIRRSAVPASINGPAGLGGATVVAPPRLLRRPRGQRAGDRRSPRLLNTKRFLSTITTN
ncbi:VOC family protein [Nonomuraea sp. NPDC049480]|uniref:VOC family protein n=1 Tax=Nonomuraea sp. NPDC049480 TaxID=3364353 RepID=UPI0037A42C9A